MKAQSCIIRSIVPVCLSVHLCYIVVFIGLVAQYQWWLHGLGKRKLLIKLDSNTDMVLHIIGIVICLLSLLLILTIKKTRLVRVLYWTSTFVAMLIAYSLAFGYEVR